MQFRIPDPAAGRMLPPRMSMEEYCEFVAELMRTADPEKVRKQKAIEKNPRVRFRIIP